GDADVGQDGEAAGTRGADSGCYALSRGGVAVATDDDVDARFGEGEADGLAGAGGSTGGDGCFTCEGRVGRHGLLLAGLRRSARALDAVVFHLRDPHPDPLPCAGEGIPWRAETGG